MSYTQRFSEGWQLIDHVYGANVAANTETNTGYNALNNFHRVAIVIDPVSLNDALDVDIEEALTTAGGSGKPLASGGHDITVAAADTAPSVIELSCDELDVDNQFDCLQVEITTANTGGNSNYFVCKIWGFPRFLPAATTTLDSVTD
jgi:hypothetical protein